MRREFFNHQPAPGTVDSLVPESKDRMVAQHLLRSASMWAVSCLVNDAPELQAIENDPINVSGVDVD